MYLTNFIEIEMKFRWNHEDLKFFPIWSFSVGRDKHDMQKYHTYTHTTRLI